MFTQHEHQHFLLTGGTEEESFTETTVEKQCPGEEGVKMDDPAPGFNDHIVYKLSHREEVVL